MQLSNHEPVGTSIPNPVEILETVRRALIEIESMSFWEVGVAKDIARRALDTAAPAFRHTVYEWCEKHHAAEFAEGLCAVRALAPFGKCQTGCEFVGDVWVGPHSPEVTPCEP